MSVVFVVGVIHLRGPQERGDGGFLFVGGNIIYLRLARIRGQEGGKRTFGGFCAVRQY